MRYLDLYISWIPRAVAFLTLAWAGHYLLFTAHSNSRFLVLSIPLLWLVWVFRREKIYAFGLSLIAANGAIWLLIMKGGDIYSSLKSRVELAINTLAMILESPIFGHGTGSYNYDYHRFQETHFGILPGKYTVIGEITIFAGNAHNLILQILAEHGIVGLGLGLLFAWFVVKRYWEKKKDRIDHACMWTLCVFFVLSLIGFPLYNAHTGLVAVTCAALICQGGEPIKTIKGWHPIPAYAGGVLGLSLLAGSGLAYAAQVNFARTTLFIDREPLTAFEANVRAYDIYPFEQHYRRQLPLTLAKVFAHYTGRVAIEPDAADKVHRIGMSAAPESPATSIARVEYLLNSGRWQEGDEIERILSNLKSTAREHAVTWLADSMYAAKLMDAQRFVASLERAQKATLYHQLHRDKANQLARMIAKEIGQ